MLLNLLLYMSVKLIIIIFCSQLLYHPWEILLAGFQTTSYLHVLEATGGGGGAQNQRHAEGITFRGFWLPHLESLL